MVGWLIVGLTVLWYWFGVVYGCGVWVAIACPFVGCVVDELCFGCLWVFGIWIVVDWLRCVVISFGIL